MSGENKGIFAGSFDPLHKGHIDVILRARKDFHLLKVVLANNPEKSYASTFDESLKTSHFKSYKVSVEVIGLKTGLVSNYVRENDINI